MRPLAFALGNTKRSFSRDLTYFLIRLPLIILGLWLGGLTGLLYARLLVGLIGIYINMRLVRSLIGLTLVSQLMANWRTLASVVSMSLAVLALRALLDKAGASLLVVLFASIPLAAASYVGTGLTLWALTGFQKGPRIRDRRSRAACAPQIVIAACNRVEGPMAQHRKALARRIENGMRRRLGIRSPPALPFSPATIELIYWRSPLGVNFGDYLSSVIVTKMAADRGFFLDEARPKPARLLAMGSILHMARDGDVLWGSGVNGKISAAGHSFRQLDVRAVRGPLTRDYLVKRGIEVPAVYGDPGLLVADLLPTRFPPAGNPDLPVVYVPYLHDRALMRGWERDLPARPRGSRSSTGSAGLRARRLGLAVWARHRRRVRYPVHLSAPQRGGEAVQVRRLCARRRSAGAGRHPLARGGVRRALMDPPKPALTALKAAFPYDLWQDRRTEHRLERKKNAAPVFS